MAYQANDVLAMMRPSGGGSVGIRVDGGMACNDLLCQFLADISGSRIIRPQTTEATALGAAIVAGYTKRLWPQLEAHVEDYTRSADMATAEGGEVDLHELFFGQDEGEVEGGSGHLASNGAAVNGVNGGSPGLLGQLVRSLSLKGSANGTANGTSKRVEAELAKTRVKRASHLPHQPAVIFEQSQDVFEPSLDEELRLGRISTWRKAVQRSLKWVKVEKQEQRKENYKRLSTLPLMIYVLLSFGTQILSMAHVGGS